MLLTLLLFSLSQPEQCGLCHPDVRVQYEQSVHSREMISCTSCHGGDPTSVSVEDAHSGSFRGGLTAKDIPALCSECHSDPVKMRPYNLSTDQLALYQTSQHGILLAQGDTNVAECTDCHGTHEILGSEDPASSVFLRNVPETCGKCHGDAELMGRYGKESNAYRDYLGSIHATKLFEENNTNSPECSRCHGVHGAAPSGVGDVAKMCGNCHSATLRAFRDSPHAAAMVEAGFPECISCHSHHSTEASSALSLTVVCLDCHGDDSEEYSIGNKMEVVLTRAEEELETARSKIREAEGIPLYVEDFRARLEEARTYLLEAKPAIHTVDLTEVERFTRAARSLGEEIEAEIAGELGELKLRRVGLLVFWFYVLLTIWILFRFRQNALKKEE